MLKCGLQFNWQRCSWKLFIFEFSISKKCSVPRPRPVPLCDADAIRQRWEWNHLVPLLRFLSLLTRGWYRFTINTANGLVEDVFYPPNYGTNGSSNWAAGAEPWVKQALRYQLLRRHCLLRTLDQSFPERVCRIDCTQAYPYFKCRSNHCIVFEKINNNLYTPPYFKSLKNNAAPDRTHRSASP